jgi:hypothetical protein
MIRFCHILVAAFLISGCTYSFRGASLPPGVHSIAIPVFDDRSGFGDPNLRVDLTNDLVNKFINDNTLQVANLSTADVAIIGTVTSVISQPVAIQGSEQVNKWRITINVNIKYQNLKTQKVIWTKDFANWGEFDPSQGASNRELGLKQAEDKISDDILLAVVTNW